MLNMQKVIDDTIKSTRTGHFLSELERLRKVDNIGYLDAIIYYCEIYDVEIESIAKLVKNDPALLAKLQEEAESLNFLEKISRLPV